MKIEIDKKIVDTDTLRARFLGVYCNLPMGERRMPISVIDDEPMSWSVAKNEIENNTKLGDRILEQLSRLEII